MDIPVEVNVITRRGSGGMPVHVFLGRRAGHLDIPVEVNVICVQKSTSPNSISRSLERLPSCWARIELPDEENR